MRSWLSRALVACSLLLIAPAEAGVDAAAPPSTPLTLDEVVQAASLRSPVVIAALADLDGARGDQRAADGAFDPTLRAAGLLAAGGYPGQRVDVLVEQPTPLWGASVFAGYRVGLGKVPDYDGKLLTNQYGEVRGGLRVPLLRDGPIDRRRAATRRADLGVTVAELGLKQQRLEVVRLASQRYWDWVAAGARVSLTRAWLDLATSRDGDLAERVRRGDIPALERSENERSILQRRAQVTAASRALAEAANELAIFLRDASGATITPPSSRLPTSIPEPASLGPGLGLDPARAAEATPARRPDLARIEAQRAQARVDVALAKNQRLPALDVLGVASKDLGAGDASRGKPVFEASMLLEVPIPGRGPAGRAQAAEAVAGRLDAQARLARDRAVAEIRNAVVAMETAAERARLADRELDVARSLAEAELARFRLGESNLLLVNLREQASLEAALRHVDALADAHKAIAAYRAATAADVR